MAEEDGGQVGSEHEVDADFIEEIVETVRIIHQSILESSGGLPGERTPSLYGACARPYQSAFGELIYRTRFEQAAAIMHGIICDHAFTNGNKRTGSVMAISMLVPLAGFSQLPLLEDIALDAARGSLTADQIATKFRDLFGRDPFGTRDESR